MGKSCNQDEGIEDRSRFLADGFLSASDLKSCKNSALLEHALKKYQESEQKYKYLIEIAPDAIFIADVETGIILEANQQAATLLGRPVEQIIGMHQSGLHPADEPEKYRQLFESHVNAEKIDVKEDLYVCRSDGQNIPVHIKTTVTELGNKKVIYGIFRDISEEKQLLNELKAGEDRFKRLSDASFEGIAIHENGHMIDANQQYLAMFGYTLEEIRSTDGLDMIAAEDRDIVKSRIAEGFEGTYEVRGLKKNGTTFPIEMRVRKSTIDGRPVRIGVIRDLTQQQEMKQRLAASEQRYRELYYNAQVALFVSDLGGLLLDCNLNTLELFGHSREEPQENYLNKVRVTDYYTDKDRRRQFVSELQQHGRVSRFEAELRRADGSLFWVSISARLSLENGTIEGALYDITASKVLTTMEKQVLDIILQGRSNKEAAKILNRSIRTIEDHRAHIMQKLNAHNLVELVQKGQTLNPEPEQI